MVNGPPPHDCFIAIVRTCVSVVSLSWVFLRLIGIYLNIFNSFSIEWSM